MEWENVDSEQAFDRVSKVGWIILLVLSVLITLVMRVYWFIIVAAIAVFRAFFTRKVLIGRQYDLMAKERGGPDWLRRFDFYETEFSVTEGKFVDRYSYSALEEILERENDVILRMEDGKLIRLLADGFIRGTWTECRALLSAKMDENDISG